MESRRDFLKKAFLLAAGGEVAGVLPASIQRALAIDPNPGSTFMDAEHVVILMQENRSFDHTYGTLRGVRGFNDPHAVSLPNGRPVWIQSNDAGETYVPFRLDIKNTNATWMGSLPHGRDDQTEARNHGRHDRWLDAKKNGDKQFEHVPLTLGYYTRDDIPFYYDLADAFTVCDQNFCASLTPTTPNRLHLWSGTVRATGSSKAHVNNSDTDLDTAADWMTFPERLEDHGVSWKIYQNEITLPSGLEGHADALLSNFGDNPIEYFSQYRVRFSASRRKFLESQAKSLTAELDALSDPAKKAEHQAKLEEIRAELEKWSEANFAKLPQREQNLHLKAFANNAAEPDFRELIDLPYQDGATDHTMPAPKGDIFFQFREDVRTGKLPAVSWLVAPEKFSDHPCSPWYGAWYVSETLDILTQNPDVWKKTIFILCYDENDGYFDHVPPFVPPHPTQPDTGKVSAGLDPAPEYVSQEQEDEILKTDPDWKGNVGPIGLGYRVPLVIASPWSRGGYVCSEVFDHTSIIKLVETLFSKKTGRQLKESNISDWRRTVCGDLSSSFRPYNGEAVALPKFIERDPFLGSIARAQFRPVPNDYKNLSADDVEAARLTPASCPWLPRQEPGQRPSCPLPYELAVNGALGEDRKSFAVNFAAGNKLFGERAAGGAFHVYAPADSGWARSYAVKPGDKISDRWLLTDFNEGAYHIRVQGPNGFFREFRGDKDDPLLDVTVESAGEARLLLVNRDPRRAFSISVEDVAYGKPLRTVKLGRATEAGSSVSLAFDLSATHGWHDLRVRVEGAPNFEQRFAGRVENGKESMSDPAMGWA